MRFPRFKPYPAYKPSGVEGLGKIPAHWEVKPLKRALRSGNADGSLIKGRMHQQPGEGLFPGFSASGQDIWLEEAQHHWPGIVLSAVGARCGKTFKADGDWTAVANTHVLFPHKGFDRDFLWYLTNDETFWDRGGTAQPFVRVPSTLQRLWCFPPKPEQRAIAAFLDRETARIDALVAKKERLIALLQEKRTALITRAVTKGLWGMRNDECGMMNGKDDGASASSPHSSFSIPHFKPSGVEWLGEIPVGWAVRRADSFLRYDKIQVEPSEMPQELLFHYSIPAVQETGDGVLQSPSEIDSAKLRVVGRRLLVSRLNPRKGVVLVAAERDVPTICSTEFVPFEVRGCDLQWALYLFLAESTRQRLSAVVRSATRSHQRAEVADVVKMWHAVPPLPEQRAIAAFLDRETAKIDALVAKVREAIERLKEYRTALISAAVTGKIDVREEATA